MSEQPFLTEEEIQRLKVLEAKASRDWHTEEVAEGGGDFESTIYRTCIMRGADSELVAWDSGYGNSDDLELAAAARNSLPLLLAERQQMQERIRQLEEDTALLAVLVDERVVELALMGSGEWLIRITRGDGSRYGAGWPTKRDALLWAKRMFDQWNAALGAPLEEGKKDG